MDSRLPETWSWVFCNFYTEELMKEMESVRAHTCDLVMATLCSLFMRGLMGIPISLSLSPCMPEQNAASVISMCMTLAFVNMCRHSHAQAFVPPHGNPTSAPIAALSVSNTNVLPIDLSQTCSSVAKLVCATSCSSYSCTSVKLIVNSAPHSQLHQIQPCFCLQTAQQVACATPCVLVTHPHVTGVGMLVCS